MAAIYKSAEGERRVREGYAAALTHWPVPHEAVRLATAQGETFVLASGDRSAPPLVLLHGSGTNAAMWMDDVAAWAARFRVYAVDLIGEPGFSAPSRPPLGSPAYAAWLDEVLDALGVAKAAFVGASLGGWLALDYAVRRPGRVERLVLVCPGGIGRQKPEVLLQALVLLMLGGWGRRKAFALVAGIDATGPETAAATWLAEVFRHFKPRTQTLPVFSDAQLAGLAMPVLLVAGARDALLDSAGTRRRLEGAAPHAQVRWLEDAGHFVLGQTQPILDFLQAPGR